MSKIDVTKTGSPVTGSPVIDVTARAQQCMLLSAAGDALGYPVEFSVRLDARHPAGFRACPDPGLISDDTQMALFSAEAVLEVRRTGRPISDEAEHAYRRWLVTQDERPGRHAGDAGLLGEAWLYHRRAPGTTAPAALNGNGRVRPDTRGCGAVMRAHPFGLQMDKTPRQCFDDAVAAGKTTHGHQDAWMPAGVLAFVVRALLDGASVRVAVRGALKLIPRESRTAMLLMQALHLSNQAPRQFSNCLDRLPRLGAGWSGDEALAMGVYAVLAQESSADILALAVTHDGDSDSTGAIAGAIAGAAGYEIPEAWLDRLEGAALIRQMGISLVDLPAGIPYPGQ